MHKDAMLEIVELCLSTDRAAYRTYRKLSKNCRDPELASFWSRMSEDEAGHIAFWNRLKKLAGVLRLPQVFDEPEKVVEELRQVEAGATSLAKDWENWCGTREAFILAFRLEFYLLHPALEMLFHSFNMVSDDDSHPEVSYEQHINRFIEAFSKFCGVSPEIDLVGEALQRLWKENRVLARQASEDSLTGLLNLRAFRRVSSHVASLAGRNRNNICIIMLDIDDFKKINDTHGHREGDQVLTLVARSIRASVRGSDIVGRYGGEEFIVLLFGPRKATGDQVAEKIRSRIESDTNGFIPVTASLGVAEGLIGFDVRKDLDKLITTADNRLYAAKQAGKNRVVSGD